MLPRNYPGTPRGNQLIVENPTPFYMNFQEITLDGKKVDKATYAGPKSETISRHREILQHTP